MLSFDERRTYFNLCDPDEPLSPKDERNVDLDRIESPEGRVRGDRWVRRLADQFVLSKRPAMTLFSGLRGSGKTTELRRLMVELSRPDGANLLPVYVSAEESIDLGSDIDVADIIAAVLHRADEVVLEAEGHSPDRALREGYAARLWHWLTATDADFGKGDLTLAPGAKLPVELRTRPSLRTRVRQVVNANLTTFLDQAHQDLEALAGRAADRGRAGLVVVFDQLEKLRGTTGRWDEVLTSAERLFGDGAPYLRLPVHVLYMVPTALLARQVAEIHLLPMIKLSGRDGQPFFPGYEAARDLVRRRIPDDVLARMLGDEAEARVEHLIRWSGGYPREIVRLLRHLVRISREPVTDRAFERVFHELAATYRMAVPEDAFDWLARVADARYLVIESATHREAADWVLRNNAVLCYDNDEHWFDLHPAVHAIPGVQEALARLRGAEDHP